MKTIEGLKDALKKEKAPACLYVNSRTKRAIKSPFFSGPGLRVRETKLALFVNSIRVIESNRPSTPWEIKK
jgi:hypothetical protein